MWRALPSFIFLESEHIIRGRREGSSQGSMTASQSVRPPLSDSLPSPFKCIRNGDIIRFSGDRKRSEPHPTTQPLIKENQARRLYNLRLNSPSRLRSQLPPIVETHKFSEEKQANARNRNGFSPACLTRGLPNEPPSIRIYHCSSLLWRAAAKSFSGWEWAITSGINLGLAMAPALTKRTSLCLRHIATFIFTDPF